MYGARIQLEHLRLYTYHPHVPVEVTLVKVSQFAKAAIMPSFLARGVEVPSLASIHVMRETAAAAATAAPSITACGTPPVGFGRWCTSGGATSRRTSRQCFVLFVGVPRGVLY